MGEKEILGKVSLTSLSQVLWEFAVKLVFAKKINPLHTRPERLENKFLTGNIIFFLFNLKSETVNMQPMKTNIVAFKCNGKVLVLERKKFRCVV